MPKRPFGCTERPRFGYTNGEQVVSPCAHVVRQAGLEPAIPRRSPVESRVRIPVSPLPQVVREGELVALPPAVFSCLACYLVESPRKNGCLNEPLLALGALGGLSRGPPQTASFVPQRTVLLRR